MSDQLPDWLLVSGMILVNRRANLNELLFSPLFFLLIIYKISMLTGK